MSIEYAILGLLSWRPLTGYDLKKVFEDSTALYWSGNNNEIYHALVRLHKEGWVTREIQPQENLPARKIYTISARGRSELNQWVRSNPEPPQLRHTFLIQLAWADDLIPRELDALLENYEEEILTQWLMCRAQARAEPEGGPPAKAPRPAFLDAAQARTPREALLWGRIRQRWLAFYAEELTWVRALRNELAEGNENAYPQSSAAL